MGKSASEKALLFCLNRKLSGFGAVEAVCCNRDVVCLMLLNDAVLVPSVPIPDSTPGPISATSTSLTASASLIR